MIFFSFRLGRLLAKRWGWKIGDCAKWPLLIPKDWDLLLRVVGQSEATKKSRAIQCIAGVEAENLSVVSVDTFISILQFSPPSIDWTYDSIFISNTWKKAAGKKFSRYKPGREKTGSGNQAHTHTHTRDTPESVLNVRISCQLSKIYLCYFFPLTLDGKKEKP